jgi:Zn-dependent protease with chaperone function
LFDATIGFLSDATGIPFKLLADLGGIGIVILVAWITLKFYNKKVLPELKTSQRLVEAMHIEQRHDIRELTQAIKDNTAIVARQMERQADILQMQNKNNDMMVTLYMTLTTQRDREEVRRKLREAK